jgi:drug/metabolite transporter (DMT)-like permease
MPVRPATLAQLALLGIAAVWGATFVMVQDAIHEMPVLTFLGYRFLAAALIVGVAFRRQLLTLGAAGWRAGLGMGAFLTAGYVLQTAALLDTSAANAGFITGLFIVFTPLLSALVLRTRVPRATWAATLVSAMGLALLAGVGGGWRPLGDGLAFGCALAFAAHILVTDAAVKRHRIGALLAVQLAVCGVVCMAGAAAMGDLAAPSRPSLWWALGVTAVVASALGFWVQSYAQRHAPPARIALILACEPAFAGLFGVTLQGDRLTGLALLGAALILTAVLAIELLPRRGGAGARTATA